jgi:hypothetical protein
VAKLNQGNLIAVDALGSPVTQLLGPGESLDPKKTISFVQRRHKVAHGDVMGFLISLSDYDVAAAEEAFDQLEKVARFFVAWFNTAPDVQNAAIKMHQWPTAAKRTK